VLQISVVPRTGRYAPT